MYLRNIFAGLVSLFKSKSVIDVLLNIDRLGNAIAGGNYKNTVSGRVGGLSLISTNRTWKVLEGIIDFTFKPIDGKGHCYGAYVWEIEDDAPRFHRRSSDISIALLSLLVVPACLLLAPVIKLYSLGK